MRMALRRNGGDVAHGHGHDAHPPYVPPSVSPEVQALREKAKQPWGMLSRDEKVQREFWPLGSDWLQASSQLGHRSSSAPPNLSPHVVYRAAFGETAKEKMKGDQDGGKVSRAFGDESTSPLLCV